MVVRLHNPEKWELLEPGKALQLGSDDPSPRLIRVQVNCPEPTRFDVSGEAGTLFLAVVHGMEWLEFTAAGVVELVPSTDTDVWYFTEDGRDVGLDWEETETFLKIMSRRPRNRAQEWAEFKLLEGRRRIEADLASARQQMAAEMAAFREEMEARGTNGNDAGVDGGAPGADDPGIDGGAGGGGEPEPVVPASKAAKRAKADGAI